MSTERAGRGTLRVGCSGWEYAHWRGDFYPRELPKDRWLAHYASAFDSVELNNSFYRLPPAATFRRWRERTPDGFRFAVKASRYLTHIRRLREPSEPLERLWSRARELGPKLGPVLYQLPPRWRRNDERLAAFLAAAPRDHPQAVEFRDPDWYAEATWQLLEGHGVALCLHDMAGSATGRRRTAPLVYVRFHGAEAKYGGRYPDETLRSWADWLAERLEAGDEVHAYFNNDLGGHAPRDAVRLREELARRG